MWTSWVEVSVSAGMMEERECDLELLMAKKREMTEDGGKGYDLNNFKVAGEENFAVFVKKIIWVNILVFK